MKITKLIGISSFICLSAATVCAQANFDPPTYPGQDRSWAFHGPPGSGDTTALWKEDPGIAGWATGHSEVQYGSDVADRWKTPVKAYGPAAGDSNDVVVLGRGGRITMTFANPIRDGEGFDFAVFEKC